ncbi:MAG TPA: enoyl-CoA hydratase/isomerase family protein [Acidimicrobiales bacterium]|nr:enoyl-CoA hydratase/isomerase family protein [Acidimicrobiales bacterium]
MASLWTVERRDRIAVATFTRPPRNFMSFAAMTELEQVLLGLQEDTSVHVVVLTGGVPRYFVAHADLDDLRAIGQGQRVEGDPASWGRALALLGSMPQPTIAAVNGQAWGGGCELSLACTIRVVAAGGHFAQPEVNVGIIPGAGGTQRLPRLVGGGRAAELVLSGRVVGAAEAVAIGLANDVLPDDGFVNAVVAWASPIASKPLPALAAAKRAMLDGLSMPLAEGLRLEGQLFIGLQTGQEALELQRGALDRYETASPEAIVEL